MSSKAPVRASPLTHHLHRGLGRSFLHADGSRSDRPAGRARLLPSSRSGLGNTQTATLDRHNESARRNIAVSTAR